MLSRVVNVRAKARVVTVWLVESEECSVTVEFPTVSTMVKVAVTVTEYLPDTFEIVWNAPPPKALRTAPLYDQESEYDVVFGPVDTQGVIVKESPRKSESSGFERVYVMVDPMQFP